MDLKNILLFESYVSSIYEVAHSGHSSNRTSLDHPQSRIVPYSIDYPYGFIVKMLVDSNERLHNTDSVEELIGIDSDMMNDYISKTLNILTNSQKLIKWKPKNDKFFQLLDLGRICFSYYGEKYYPLIAGGKGPQEGGFHDSGDRIWMFLKGEGSAATTIKYYESTEGGRRLMFSKSASDAGMSGHDFYEVSAYGYPYGRNFEVVIDVTQDYPEELILERIRKQIEGN